MRALATARFSRLSDDTETTPKRRGRPPKARPEAEPAAPAAPPPPPAVESAPPPPAASAPAPQSNDAPSEGGFEPRGDQQGQRFNNQNQGGNNRRDRFRNRRDRQRDRYQNGLPQDDAGGNGEGFVPRPHPQVPEGFPTYSLGDLKRMPAPKLLDVAEQLQITDGVSRARKQDIIFAILKVLTRHGEGVQADGVLEILPDGFGFLRAAEASYLAGPDDVYISPSQIRRFNLRTGDHIAGRIRWPKDGERYFALNVVDTIRPRWPRPMGATRSRMRPVMSSVLPLPRSSVKRWRGNSGVRFSNSALFFDASIGSPLMVSTMFSAK